ncbi:hypothetical protein F4824DRAFT_512813 [Ustulina deusta]|nr:hypothetical protein F4824DRAFT_512813 [Ustulina deusta]
MNTVADSPEYPELYALSQPQRSEPHSQVKNATLDLQQSVEGLAKSFSHILRVTHIFFCAYLAGPDKAEAAHINGYSCTPGTTVNPHERMPQGSFWLEQKDRSPNFWCTQQRILEKNVVGFAWANLMSLISSLGLFRTLSTTGRLRDTTTSTTPQNANNQCFHAVNENVQNRQNLWPRPAKRHRYTIPDKMFPSPNGEQPAYPGYESGVVKRGHQELRPRLH